MESTPAEVAWPAPEVRPIDAREEYSSKEVSGPPATDSVGQAPSRICGLRKRLFWLVVVVAGVLLVLAVVLGAVLGTRHLGTSSTTTNDKAPPASASPASIRPNSGLGVTGWRDGSDFSIRLLYQSNDGFLRLIGLESKTGNWTAPVSLTRARPGTSLALSSFYAGFFWTADYTQVSAYFLDDANLVQEWIVQESEGISTGGNLAPALGATVTAKSTSKLASYWPSTVFQDDSHLLQEVLFNGSIPTGRQAWNHIAIELKGEDNTFLVGVALPTDLSRNVSGLRLFYQRDDGKLFAAERNNGAATWTTGKRISPIKVHPKPPSAHRINGYHSLEYLEPRDTTRGIDRRLLRPEGVNRARLDFYVLWQDESGTLQMNWEDDESGWKGPTTSPSLKDADKGTNIACLNPSVWSLTAVEPKWDMARCYFQSSGLLKEVRFTGQDWVVAGNVPVI